MGGDRHLFLAKPLAFPNPVIRSTQIFVIAPIVAASLIFAGCAGFEKAPKLPDTGSVPSSSEVKKIREESGYWPAYWLGHSYEGRAISSAEARNLNVSVSYGKRDCYEGDSGGPGCWPWPILIERIRGRDNPFMPPVGQRFLCIHHIRGAVLLMGDCRNRECPMTQEGWLFSGDSTIYLSTFDKKRHPVSPVVLAQQILRIDGRQRLEALPAPDPISCPAMNYLAGV
jgi:hypothetical protein